MTQNMWLLIVIPISVFLFAIAAVAIWAVQDTIRDIRRKRQFKSLTDEAMINLVERLQKEGKKNE